MKNKIFTALLFAMPFVFTACHYGENIDLPPKTRLNLSQDVKIKEPPYDEKKGLGPYDSTNVNMGALDVALAEKGKALLAEQSCAGCHSIDSDATIMGPGWKGLTKHRTPYWLMNFISDPAPMLKKDAELMEWVAKTSVEMPNPGLDEDQVKAIVEYMRQLDGVK